MKKKILIIGLTERMGGVETFIYNTTRFSDSDKYEYDFLVHGTDHTVFEEEIKNFYQNDRNHFFFVPSFKKNPVKSYIELAKFYKKYGNSYDYVHLQTGATSEIVYVFPFALLYKFKVIVHSHNGNGYSPIVNTLFKPIVNSVSSKRLSCSKEATEWLFGKKNNNVQIINNGIDTNRFKYSEEQRNNIRSKYNLDKDTFVVGHIGRFSEQKNHKFLIDIFEKIVQKEKKAKLMLVGVGELEIEIKNIVHEKKLEDNVIFCGAQAITEAYYSAFDIFLMPSLYEGLPIVGIEAQSEGLPCYFSNNISDQIKITDNARLLSLKEDADYWSKQILSRNAIQNREEYADKVSNSGYSIKNTVKKLEKVYEVNG